MTTAREDEVGETSTTAPEDAAAETTTGRFTVRLENFEGPFDLLLQLIAQHRLDVTEVALHQVTDDFIAHIRAMGDEWDLDETTEFLVVAATLLDLKAARLLPAAEVEDEEDLALLEARDLLFARLLQYRAFKQVAALFAELEAGALRRYPRSVSLEERYAGLLPEVMLGVDAARFAEIAAAVFRPKPPPTVSLDHVHMHRVSVREHAAVLRVRLAELGEATFGALVADCAHTIEVVARFLALLELYREGVVLFEQPDPLGELRVRWTGGSVEQARADAEAERANTEEEEYG
ncbi:MAG TPA: segregation/condensation protein A [Pseudonocardiaceae bacterium]